MRIGFFTDSYLPQLDGVATTVASLATTLQQRGHEVSIIAPKYPMYKDSGNVNVFRLRSVKVHNEPEIRFGLQLPEKAMINVLKMDFDIIHGHAGGTITFLGWQVARLKNIPYVATYHTLWSRYHHYFFKGKIITPKMLEVTSKIFCNICDYVIAPSEEIKKELLSYGVRRSVVAIPSGVDLGRFSTKKKGYLRSRLKIPKDLKILLYVGRLGKEKSVDLLIEAFSQVRNTREEVVLVLVGAGTEELHLKRLAKKNKLESSVFFTGPITREDIQDVYSDADIFLFASTSETQGMVVFEALASGLPVIAATDRIFKNIIINGTNGYLVEANKHEFSKKIVQLLLDDQLRKNMGDNAKELVKQYALSETVRLVENLYKKVLRIHKKKPRGFKERLSYVNEILQNLRRRYEVYLR